MPPRAPCILTSALLLGLAWRRALGHAAARGPSALGSGEEEPRPRARLTPDWGSGGTPLARTSASSAPSAPLAAGAPHERGEHDPAGPVPGRMRRRSFEQCPASAGGAPDPPWAASPRAAASSRAASLAEGRRSRQVRRHRASAAKQESECEHGTLIGAWGPDFKYTQTCCVDTGFCAGCAATDGGRCGQCDAGYALQVNESLGKCAMCDDITGWEDENGKTCIDYETNGNCSNGQPPSVDEPFKGLKPSDACCICGGGQLKATPWRYKISQQALVFGANVSAMPSPQTASRYEVSPDCALGQLGLSLGGGGVLSGTLPMYEEGASSYEIDCNVVAVEDEVRGLSAINTLKVSVQPMSYGPKVVVFRFVDGGTAPTGQRVWPLTVAPGLHESLHRFRVACVPAVPWIAVAEDSGTLSYSGGGPREGSSGNGLSGEHSGFSSGKCALTALHGDIEVEAVFAVVELRVWAAMAYERGVLARVGRPIVPLPLVQKPPPGYATRRDEHTGGEYWFSVTDASEEKPVPKALHPTVLSVACSGANHTHWSRQTGEVTIEGQRAFVIDPATGQISGTPEVDLPQHLGSSSLMLACHVAAGGPNYESVLTTTLYVELIDDTCFYEMPISEPVWAIELEGPAGRDPAGSCRTMCRKRQDCAAYWVEEAAPVSRCFALTSDSAQDGAGEYAPDAVAVRAKCEEGKSCLRMKSRTAAFLEGLFCPKGFYAEEDYTVRALGRSENVFAKQHDTAGSDFIMFSKQATHTRFPELHGDNSEHFVAVKYNSGAWSLNNNGVLHSFEPVETDALVAGVDLGSKSATLLEGVREVYNDVEKGYSDGDLSIKAECGSEAAVCISGSWWRPWDIYDEATATLYSRPGVTAAEEFWMARGSCPLPGQTGTWVIRQASAEDYMNPETGASELHGEVMACITEDIESDVFALGRWTSGVSLPSETAAATDDNRTDSPLESFFEDVQAITSESPGHTITASLTSLSCQQPAASTDMLLGSVSSPGSYSLHACECFGWEHKDTEPVTEESRDAVPEMSSGYNSFTPAAQLLFDGPYVCEEDAVLPFGQKNEITEEACHGDCLGNEGCSFYMYVAQLRFCLLLSKCESLGHTGLDITHLLYGVFRGETEYCRIADPEACWVSRKRRELLDGRMTAFSSCAFQDVVSKCDTMQMATTEAHGECRGCEYFPISSAAAKGRSKVPLPTSFPGGSQVVASCDMSDVGARLQNNLLMQGSQAVLTCVDGTWRGAGGLEGVEHLSCVSCVHVAQQGYAEALESLHPELYYLSRRELQYHFGTGGSGCQAASEATSSPLVNARKGWCMKFNGAGASAGADCSQSWYLSQKGDLLVAGLMSACLKSTQEGGLEVTARCSEGKNYWEFNPQRRLVNLNNNKCLSQSSDDGSLELLNCSYNDEDDPAQVWYFDGGDCQYQMHVRSHAEPPVWNFKIAGDTYLGAEHEYGVLTTLSEAQEGIDPLAFGTCKISLSASLEPADDNLFEKFDLTTSAGQLDDEFNHAFAFGAHGGIVSTCAFGGTSGIKSVAQFKQQKAEKEAKIYDLENTCDYAKKTSSPNPKYLPNIADYDKYVDKEADGENMVLSGVWSQHSNHYEDRVWRIAFAEASGVTVDSSGKYWSDWSDWDQDTPGDHECQDNHVLTGIRSKHDDGKEDRRFRIQCSPVTGHRKTIKVDTSSTYLNDFDGDLSFISLEEEFVIGMKSTHDNGLEDRRFAFPRAKFCTDNSAEVALLEEQIAELDAKIKAVSEQEVTCATDFPMHIETLRVLDISYPADDVDHVPSAKASISCHLMHRGHPGSAAGFALSAPQLTEMVRAEVYRTEEAESPWERPFQYTGSDGEPPAKAMKIGYFAMVEHGATLWGVQCRPGAVVAVDSSAGSPYCFYVNAVPGDVVMGAILPESASCELGYAVGGWYNLGVTDVQQRGSGGPSEPTGFRLTCRAVPGLSRLCELKEGRCEANEVVTGLAYEKGHQIKYKCCKAPETVGHVFAHDRLLDMKPWEGYYCPVGFDRTGRAVYEMARALAPAAPHSSSWWPQVHRSTPPAGTGDGSLNILAHEPQCGPGELMTSWNIQRRGPGKITVVFSCAKLGFSGGGSFAGLQTSGCKDQEAEYDEKGTDVGLLLNHQVECPSGHALAGWGVQQDSAGEKMRYVFSCCAVDVHEDGEGFEYWGRPEEEKPGETLLGSMEQHGVSCPLGSVIRGFRIERWNLRYLRYWLRCVGVRTETRLEGESHRLAWNRLWGTWVLWQIPVVERRTGTRPTGDDTALHLYEHEVECSDGFAMQGFRLDNLHGYSHRSVAALLSKDFGESGIPAEQQYVGHYHLVARCRATQLGACSNHLTAKEVQESQGSVTDLSRHNIVCLEDRVLQRFRVRTTTDEMWFDYDCCEVPGLKNATCYDANTSTASSEANVYALADIEVKCKEGMVLQQMELQVHQGTGDIYWSYRCCPARGMLHSDGGVRSSSTRPEDEAVGVNPGALRVKVLSPSSLIGQDAKVWLDDELQPATSSANGSASIDVLALDGASRKYLKSCWEIDTSFDGHGLQNISSIGSAAACQKSCREAPDCGGFTYSPDAQECHLKRSDAGRKQQEGSISGPKQCHLRSFSPGRVGDDWISAMAAHLNSLARGSVVILSMRGTARSDLSGRAVHALQRCGARELSVSGGSWGTGDAYALISVVDDGDALAEGFSESVGSSVSLNFDLPDPFTAAPLVGFSAAFVNAARTVDPFPKERPVKPELLSFSATRPDYDEFCDVAMRQNLRGCDDGNKCPEEQHPCHHTYANRITEQAWWRCTQRDIDRDYVDGIAEAQQAEYEAEMSNLEMIWGWVEMGVTIAASAIAAIPYGSYAVPANEGAGQSVESAEKGTKASASGVLSKSAKKTNAEATKKLRKVNKDGLTRFQQLKKNMGENWMDLTTPILEQGFDHVGSYAVRKDALGGVTAETDQNAFNEQIMIGDDGSQIDAVPELEPPDMHGYAAARNAKTFATADWTDCHPLQQGLSKVMCDLYCTENAVKEGNTAVISNIRRSHSVLMTNIERLLDYHTQTLMWGMGQLRDQLAQNGGGGRDDLLLWGAGDEQRGPTAGGGGGGRGPAADTLGLGRVRAALEELRALPRLLEANGTVLEVGAHSKASSALTHDMVDWHNEASQRMLGRLHDVLEHATNATGGVPGAIHQATSLVRRFASERALRLREPAPERHQVVQSMTTKKAAALRTQIHGRAKRLERVASLSSPLRGASPEALLDLIDDDVIIRWNQLADHFVAAHEKHAVFAQARARALAAAEDAVRNAESYVGCAGRQLGDLQDSWQHALRVEDHAADVLLEAWASTVAAQERLQMAVDAGLLKRIAGVAAIRAIGGGGCSGEVALVAEEAHTAGVRAVDRALWPLLEQVLVLEQIAKYQEDEIRAKKLHGVDRVPVTPTLQALHRLASDGADPATPTGRALAARALDRLGPAACPAPDGCGAGMLLFNSTEGFAWTAQQPGLLLLQMEGASAGLAKACAPPGGLCTDPSRQQSESLLLQEQKQQQPHEPQQRCGPGCEEKLRLTLSRKRSTIREAVELLRHGPM